MRGEIEGSISVGEREVIMCEAEEESASVSEE